MVFKETEIRDMTDSMTTGTLFQITVSIVLTFITDPFTKAPTMKRK